MPTSGSLPEGPHQERARKVIPPPACKKLENFGFFNRTFSEEVRVKRDESRSETDFGGSGSLRGSIAISKTARKLGIFCP